MIRLRSWFARHAITAHIVGPVWVRIPGKWRWRIVSILDRSRTRCWSSLVDAALATGREDDACDVRTPLGCKAGDCPTTCYWSHFDHQGNHDCGCYCGKFRFQTTEGYLDRKAGTP